MCLTIPGEIVAVDRTDPAAPKAVVDYSGERRTVSLLYVPEAAVGEYVVVHAGFATSRLPESEALETLRYARAMSPLSPSRRPGNAPDAAAVPSGGIE